MEFNFENRDRVLEAIDQLRHRKARPDAQRICNFLFRKYSINSLEAKNYLQWCVDNNFVLRVEYKGSISYRNASKKLSRVRRDRVTYASLNKIKTIVPTEINKGNKKFAQFLTQAFSELIVSEPDYLATGVPGEEIIQNVLSKDSVRYTKKYINILLDKEVENGSLIKMENGNYLMGPVNRAPPAISVVNFPIRTAAIKSEPLIVRNHRIDNFVDLTRNDRDEGVETIEIVSERLLPQVRVKTPELKRERDTNLEPKLEPELSEPEPFISPPRSPEPPKLRPQFKIIRIKKKLLNKPIPIKKESVARKIERKMHQSSSRVENGNLRVGGRRKRAKKVFDPSDTHVPKKRGRPAGSLNKATIEKHVPKTSSEDSRPESRSSNVGRNNLYGVCSVCHIQNKKDRMVACSECSNKAHFSCLNGDDMMLRMYPDNTWQCPHCKTCTVCFETADAGNLIVCSVCADAYHPDCHQPRITEKLKNTSKWLCTNCLIPDEFEINKIQSNMSFQKSHSYNDDLSSGATSGNTSPSNFRSSQSSPTAPRLSPQNVPNGVRVKEEMHSDSDSKFSDEETLADPSIPDASLWSIDEVYKYFVQYFPDEAKIFKDQEIDGRSLLLLRRIDVLTSMKLRLGPALKIYKHILKLQVRMDDPKLYWQ